MESEKIKILFVCLGNICRSPMAETIFNHMAGQQKNKIKFEVDSAGLIDYHKGEKADARMRKYAQQKGYNITHLSRPITPRDIFYYDHIIGMDEKNIAALHQMTNNNQDSSKIHRMTDFLRHHTDTYVPDPYYGGHEEFEYVIQLLEDACGGLYQKLINQ